MAWKNWKSRDTRKKDMPGGLWMRCNDCGSTVYRKYPLAPREVVENYREHAKKVEELESALKELVDGESIRLSEILARKTSRYLTAACHLLEDPTRSASLLAQEEGLDHEVLRNWMDYVGAAKREHPYLSTLDHLRARGAGRRELQQAADEFQSLVLDVLAEKKSVDAKNEALVEAAKPDVDPETAVYLPNGYRAVLSDNKLFLAWSTVKASLRPER